jgi:chemotaxis protein methyltransferase CheR
MARTALNAAPVIREEDIDAAREFEFSDADFRSLVQLAHEYAGIALADNKRNLVYTRVSRRLRALRLNSFRDYRKYLASHGDELESFINAISTNLTKFFRESHHFDHFRMHVVAPFAQSLRGGTRRFRIWSAGCSTGEEPYTIAAVLRHGVPDAARHDIRVLATDIDTDVLGKGTRGEYPVQAFDDIPETYHDYFRAAANGKAMHAEESLRSLITFRRLNLIEPFPFSGKFDAIFCRNVMIYFDGPTKSDLIDRFIQALNVGGFLYIGHSESLLGSHPELQLVGRTIYRRKG